MTACTSPARTSSSTHRTISAQLTITSKSSITSIDDPLSATDGSANTALETHAEELLGFHGELHRQLAKDLLAESVDDHRHGILRRDAPLPTIEELVLADLRGRGLMFDLGGAVGDLEIREGMGAALVAEQQGVTPRVVPRAGRALQDLHQPTVG